MLKFNEEQQIKDIRGALALRSDVEKVVDQVWTKGFDAVYYLGIGGTYASAMQAVTYAMEKVIYQSMFNMLLSITQQAINV